MKKIITTIFLIISSRAFAQMYISAGAGYLFPGKSMVPIDPYYVNCNPYSSNIVGIQTRKITHYSFASGPSFNIAAGYALNNDWGLELSANATLGNSYTSNFNVTNDVQGNGYTYIGYWKIKAPVSLFITPSLVFKGTEIKGIIPYCRLGLMIMGYGKQKSIYAATVYTPVTTKDIYNEDEITNNLSVGLAGAIGANIKLKNNLSLGIEFYLQSISPYIKKSVTTKYIEDGKDLTSHLKKSESEIGYYKTYQERFWVNPDEPTQSIGFKTNYSNMGLMVHIIYNFNKKRKSN